MDDFFSNFELDECRISADIKTSYRAYNRALMTLDDKSWNILKKKALQQYPNHSRIALGKEAFFNHLNEAFAYRYLVNKGFGDVRFIEEGKEARPDIGFTIQGIQSYCEVKTLGISNDEIIRRTTYPLKAYGGSNCVPLYTSLSDGFLNKFCKAVQVAKRQIGALGCEGLVYVVMQFDDIALDYYEDCRQQLIAFAATHGFDNMFIKIGLLGNKRVCITKKLQRTRIKPRAADLGR